MMLNISNPTAALHVCLSEMLGPGTKIAPLTVEQHRSGRVELPRELAIDPATDFRFKLVQLNVELYHQMKQEAVIPSNEHIELLGGLMFWVDRSEAQPVPLPHEMVALTIEQYHRLNEIGTIPSGTPIELIHGLLVWKDRSARGGDFMTIGNSHRICVRRLMDLAAKIIENGCDLFVQAPLQMPDCNEPEPDGYIVKQSAQTYLQRHPDHNDVWCAIEVSDSSLPMDRHEKLRLYASAGIPQYIIVNLVDSQIEVHEQPRPAESRYAQTEIFKAGQKIQLLVGADKRLEIEAQSILP